MHESLRLKCGVGRASRAVVHESYVAVRATNSARGTISPKRVAIDRIPRASASVFDLLHADSGHRYDSVRRRAPSPPVFRRGRRGAAFWQGGAAPRLAQPPLSQQIGRLERLVGQRLFERKPHVRLTSAGEALLPTARAVLADVSAGIDAARQAGSGLTGRLTIGFASSVLPGRFPAAIRAYRERYPAVELRLRELASAAQIDALRRGLIDVGVMREALEADDLACETLFDESFVVALPNEHPLASERSIALASLASLPFVHFPRDVAPALYDRVLTMCGEAGFTPRIIQEAREWLTIVGLVDAGLGVAIVPSSFKTLRWGNVRYMELRDVDVTTPV